ncbi:hypothetical protein JOB18_047126 [Solea senegalensis]|uniref:Uncharacterized protein n=1 Tax=Solea senegalensis TaxID=28829 RepID=A0AAV6R8I3_SOLSE|nr:hypothetical protein JOB18_047126 [Solea senegalensis]
MDSIIYTQYTRPLPFTDHVMRLKSLPNLDMDIHTPTYRHGKSSSSHLQSLDSSGSVKQRLGSSVASLSSWQQQSGSGGSKCLMHAGGDYMPELLDSIQHTALDERQGGKTQC